jgi:hypothetical protein
MPSIALTENAAAHPARSENRLSRTWRSACSYISENRLLVLFVAIALLCRLVFWVYTGRTWEDALITLTPARNAWEGYGLTHHASEPRIHSFTSPISVLIPLIGESVGQGLFTLKLVSLLAVIPTIYYAYCIGEVLSFHWSCQVLVLSYLATDQLQIFFGMSGMETQMATAIALANAYYLLTSQWWKLGAAVGLGVLCRPEFIFWVPIVGLYLVLFHRHALLPFIAVSAAVALPWYIFATLYYGSPIPHTVAAKSWSYRLGFLYAGWPRIFAYAAESWTSFAPFRQFWFAVQTPIPDAILKGVVASVTGLALIGVARSFLQHWRLLPVAAFIAAFFVYRTGSTLSTYFMWYLPPFVALLFIFAGYGLSGIATYSRLEPVAAILSLGLAFVYAMHIPFSFPLERIMQREIEEKVRLATGLKLNELMRPEDTAVLEPLGYIGWGARNKTIYDMPGLGSRVSVDALAASPRPSLPTLIDALKPNYAVLRPRELGDFKRDYPDTFALYEPVARIQAEPDLNVANLGYRYKLPDKDFAILKRS